MSDSKVCPHKEFTHECIDCLQVQVEELEAENQRLRDELMDYKLALAAALQEIGR